MAEQKLKMVPFRVTAEEYNLLHKHLPHRGINKHLRAHVEPLIQLLRELEAKQAAQSG